MRKLATGLLVLTGMLGLWAAQSCYAQTGVIMGYGRVPSGLVTLLPGSHGQSVTLPLNNNMLALRPPFVLVPFGPAMTPQGLEPAMNPQGLGAVLGSRGYGTALGEQGYGTALGRQGYGTALGQQGYGTALGPPSSGTAMSPQGLRPAMGPPGGR